MDIIPGAFGPELPEQCISNVQPFTLTYPAHWSQMKPQRVVVRVVNIASIQQCRQAFLKETI